MGYFWMNPDVVDDPRVLELGKAGSGGMTYFVAFLAALARAQPQPVLCPNDNEYHHLMREVGILDDVKQVENVMALGLNNGLFRRHEREDGFIEWNLVDPRRYWRHLGPADAPAGNAR